MSALNIRKFPDELHQRLRVRAARNRRSMESEARAILAAALRAEGDADFAAVDAMMLDHYGGQLPTNIVDDFIAERRREAARETGS